MAELHTLYGNNDGTLTPGEIVALNRFPSALVVDDWNNDTFPDIATANTGAIEDVSIMFGNGSGGVSAPLHLAAGASLRSIDSVDVNADGLPDLVIVNSGSSAPGLSILLSNGDETFDEALQVPSARSITAVAAGDLDQNGFVDFAVVGSLEVSVFLNLDGSTFDQVSNTPINVTAPKIVAKDIDGDGKLDLVVSHSQGAFVTVLRGLEAGSLAAPEQYAVMAIENFDFDLADVNDDGFADIINTSKARDRVAVLLNQSDLNIAFDADASTTLSWTALGGAVTYDVYRGLLSELADPDGDNLPDLGYGDCVNKLDDDITDTRFDAPEIPPSGEGFFYLVARVGGGGSTSLGTTSTGQERQPSMSCSL